MTSVHHPVDSVGLPLPDASWPDAPGSAGGLEIVRRFGNTINREQGGDAWRTVNELNAWLTSEGWQVQVDDDDDLASFRSLRDRLFVAVREHDMAGLSSLDGSTVVARFDGGRLSWRGTGAAAACIAGELLMALHTAHSLGTWHRLKACQHCGWLFYDASRNRSGRWCSMSACGGREKARAYRRRRAS